MPSPFHKFNLPFDHNLFEELSHSVDFEVLGKGRKGNHLVQLSEAGVPTVRTTSKYNIAAQNFRPIHNIIVENIKTATKEESQFSELSFNNALIEIYDQQYRKMKYHSDQALDLAEESYIALFSCYAQPEALSEQALRKLKVQNKVTGAEFEYLLTHNSVILFSLETNSQFMHKIVLEAVPGQKPAALNNRWLGITFRQSKTFINFKDGLPYFLNGELLQLADEAQAKEFYLLRGQENNSQDFIYPELAFTLSVGDRLMPKE